MDGMGRCSSYFFRCATLYKEKWLNFKGLLSYCPWMHAILIAPGCMLFLYDFEKLKVLIFGVDEDGKLQVKVAVRKIQEVVSHLIYTQGGAGPTLCGNHDEIFHGDELYESMGNG